MKDYHNTNHETGETLKSSRARARGQTDRILDFFKGMKKPLATFQVRKMLFDDRIDKTSVQRSISNLTKAGFLEKIKLDELHEVAPSGKRVHCWRLVPALRNPVAYGCGVVADPFKQAELFAEKGGANGRVERF